MIFSGATVTRLSSALDSLSSSAPLSLVQSSLHGNEELAEAKGALGALQGRAGANVTLLAERFKTNQGH